MLFSKTTRVFEENSVSRPKGLRQNASKQKLGSRAAKPPCDLDYDGRMSAQTKQFAVAYIAEIIDDVLVVFV